MHIIDLGNLFEETAKLGETEAYLEEIKTKTLDGKEVILTGRAPVWLYLKIAHALHGSAKRLYYDSPVTGSVLIFDHDPL